MVKIKKTRASGRRLKMSFDPNTIEHLGIKMYSNLPNAIAELIANSYDADAKKVDINLIDKQNNKRIEVIDDGVGMSFEEVNQKFLRIGRKRREEGSLNSPSGKRKVTGRKGLGKLAFFGIGNIIEISTIKKNSGEKITFTLDWNTIIHTHNKDYQPVHSTNKCDRRLHGTTIILRDLKRKTGFDKEELAESISKLFNLFDNSFKVQISLNKGKKIQIDDKLKYKSITKQFDWSFPAFSKYVSYSYTEKRKISGKIFSTEKPLKPGLRGITLFANGRLVNASEFFGVSESSHGFSYFTGWLDVDFVDNWKEDVISTDRQSLNWDLPRTSELREFLKKAMLELERQWRGKRKEKRRENIQSKTNINIKEWYETLPSNIKEKVEFIVNAIDDSELPDENQTSTVQYIHELIPEYPNFHWRHIHDAIRKASHKYYINKDFYTAFLEALKRYIQEVKKRSGSTNSVDRSMMGEVFSGRKLSVTKKFKKSDGTSFSGDTIKNIEEGQHYLSEGIVIGGRNPLSHEEHIELRETGLFSEKDCLDFLSLLSHLFKRLDDSEKP